MISLSVFPLIAFGIQKVIYQSTLYYLKNFRYVNHNNNHSDNLKFIELFAGPEYNFSIKSASLNCILFTTLCFGSAFPIFYIIALFAIVLQYAVDRYSLATFYRLPPRFPLDLTQMNVYAICPGALFSCFITFWMLGNPLMFTD